MRNLHELTDVASDFARPSQCLTKADRLEALAFHHDRGVLGKTSAAAKGIELAIFTATLLTCDHFSKMGSGSLLTHSDALVDWKQSILQLHEVSWAEYTESRIEPLAVGQTSATYFARRARVSVYYR